MAKSRCVAVQHGLCVTAYGAVNPCCMTHGDFSQFSDISSLAEYNSHDSNLKSAREYEFTNNWLKECVTCKKKDDAGLISRKKKFSQWYPWIDDNFSHDNPNAIVHMDISFGNTCNQQCIMCSSQFSSKWTKDDAMLAEQYPFLERSVHNNWSLTYNQIDQIVDLISEYTKVIEIKGGEPMVDKRYLYFISKAKEKNPDIIIHTITNGSYFTPNVLDILKQYSNLNFSVSIDGIGKSFDLIRGYSFQEVETNFLNALRELPNSKFKISYTVMKYNVDKLQEFYNWATDIVNKTKTQIEINFGQIVTYPKYLSPIYAGEAKIESALEQIEVLLQDANDIKPGSVFFNTLNVLKSHLLNTSINISSSEIEKVNLIDEAMSTIRGVDNIQDQFK